MKEGTYYSRNRERILEREKNKRISQNLETKLKKQEYNRKYYLENLKNKRQLNKLANKNNILLNRLLSIQIKPTSLFIKFD